MVEALAAGATVLVSNRFVPGEDVKRMKAADCAAIFASPSYFRMLLKFRLLKRGLLPQLKHIVLGSAAVSSDLVAALQNVWPNATISIRYGLSESVGTLARLDLPPGTALKESGMVGQPLPGVELSPDFYAASNAGGQGALAVRSGANGVGVVSLENSPTPKVQPLSRARDGFLDTGDQARLTDQGLLCFVVGFHQFIKHRGHRIEPGEIVRVLVYA